MLRTKVINTCVTWCVLFVKVNISRSPISYTVPTSVEENINLHYLFQYCLIEIHSFELYFSALFLSIPGKSCSEKPIHKYMKRKAITGIILSLRLKKKNKPKT